MAPFTQAAAIESRLCKVIFTGGSHYGPPVIMELLPIIAVTPVSCAGRWPFFPKYKGGGFDLGFFEEAQKGYLVPLIPFF